MYRVFFPNISIIGTTTTKENWDLGISNTYIFKKTLKINSMYEQL